MIVGSGGWSAVQLTSGANAVTASGGNSGTHPSTTVPHLEGDADAKFKGKGTSSYGGGCILGTYYTVEGTDRNHVTIDSDHIFCYEEANLVVNKLSNFFLSPLISRIFESCIPWIESGT